MGPIPAKKLYQTPLEPMPESIQAMAIVVIHPGSMFLRIGRPSDTYPITVPHVIARRCKPEVLPYICDHVIPRVALDLDSKNMFEEALKSAHKLLLSCITSEGKTRYVGSQETIRDYNSKSKPTIEGFTTLKKLHSIPRNVATIIGQDVLSLGENEPFHINWPLRRGRLNLHDGIGGSLSAVLSDLETIWSYAIEKHLNIPLNDLMHYRAVLVIPDIYNRRHVKEMVNILLNNIGFGSCFVHLESVCATFGAGLSYACVLDCGDQKTTIACVEDGISHTNSRLTMEYGGSDLTQLFHWLLHNNLFPYRKCDLSIRSDAILLQKIKETVCHLNLDVCGLRDHTFSLAQPGMPVINYTVMLGDECLVAPLALFSPELLALTGTKRCVIHILNEGGSEDPNDENYLIQTQRRGAKETIDGGGTQGNDFPNRELDENAGIDEEMEIPSECTSNYISDFTEIQCNQLYGVDQAVVQSIDRCDTDDLKRRMHSCLLVVGGGMMFPGIHTWLKNRLAMQTPLNYRGEGLDIVVRPKDMDPRITVWKGAAVMSCLDTAQELWITSKEWQRYGIKVLRERAPFTW